MAFWTCVEKHALKNEPTTTGPGFSRAQGPAQAGVDTTLSFLGGHQATEGGLPAYPTIWKLSPKTSLTGQRLLRGAIPWHTLGSGRVCLIDLTSTPTQPWG